MSTLSELFDRDPLSLSEQDLATIVERMRQAQAQHELGVKPPKPDKPKVSKKTMDILKDLGLT